MTRDPSNDGYRELAATAERAAQAGAEVLRRSFRQDGLEIHAKGRHDFVTRADHDSEAAVIAEIRRRYPDHRILAEESGYRGSGEAELEWFVDPLDGTTNFLQGLPIFCVSVGCSHRGRMAAAAVVDPMGDHLFSARRGGGAFWNGEPMRVSERRSLDGAFLATGYPFRALPALDVYLEVFRAVFLRARSIRRCGAAALDLAYTAAGVYDGFFEFRLSPWDFAAGTLLLAEAGGRVTDLDGGEGFFTSGNLVAGPPELQADLLETVRAHVDEAGLESIDPARDPHGAALV